MRWFQVLDTQTGAKHNELASDIAGAKRGMALVAASGLAGRRGTAIEGTRYSVEGQTFDVAFHMEAPDAGAVGIKAAQHAFATPAQLRYLNDLVRKSGQGEAVVAAWVKPGMTKAEASRAIAMFSGDTAF